ncbi:MAG: hypothetical protein K0Q66_1585 [Chitinophagaceae bacterium]|jgi:hypothetical protein|nr:hypothetical protein [Chitinophagaceae bacterium]
MKPLTILAALPLIYLLLSFYPPENKFSPPKEMSQCEGVKAIAEAFKKAEYDKVKGEPLDDFSEESSSLITLTGYEDPEVYEDETEIYLEARYDKFWKSADEMNTQLKKLVEELQKCLNLKPQRLATDKFTFYIFRYADDVEVKLTGAYAARSDRYLDIEINRQK